jgi:cell division protein FtsQ
MPAVKRRSAPRRQAPPPPPPKYSRLEAIHRAHQSGVGLAPNTPPAKSLLAGIVLFSGVAIAGAAFLGPQLYDAREAAAATVDAAATAVGMRVHAIEAPGLDPARQDEIRQVALPEGRLSMLAADPQDVKARVESLDWVARAEVQRLWPSTVRISVTQREAMARWQENGMVTLVDAAGERVHASDGYRGEELPLLVGAGAGPAAEPVLRALENLPAVRDRLVAFIRIGDRRFDARLEGGVTVMLPERDPVAALQELEGLHRTHRILDRAVARIDLRLPQILAVTPAASSALNGA